MNEWGISNLGISHLIDFCFHLDFFVGQMNAQTKKLPTFLPHFVMDHVWNTLDGFWRRIDISKKNWKESHQMITFSLILKIMLLWLHMFIGSIESLDIERFYSTEKSSLMPTLRLNEITKLVQIMMILLVFLFMLNPIFTWQIHFLFSISIIGSVKSINYV